MNARMARYLAGLVLLCAGIGCAPTLPSKWVWDAHQAASAGHTDELNAKLTTQISVAFDGEQLGHVIDDLRQLNDINLIANWMALEAVGIESDNKVILKINRASLSQVLDVLTDTMGGGETEICWEVDRDVIRISTAEDISRHTVSRIYDVSDLIRNQWGVRATPYIPGLRGFCDAPNCPHHGKRPQGGCFGPGIVPTCANCGYSCSCRPLPRLLGADAIIELLVYRIEYESWRVHGGNVGFAQAYGPLLVIQQTRKAHEEIEALLEILRDAVAHH